MNNHVTNGDGFLHLPNGLCGSDHLTLGEQVLENPAGVGNGHGLWVEGGQDIGFQPVLLEADPPGRVGRELIIRQFDFYSTIHSA